jgi:FixJ family two-component response regulator
MAQTVYIVDDDASVRAALGALLGSVGFASVGYASAEEFLGAVDPGTRGCLLLDVRMPGMSGLDLQGVLAARGIRMPVIVITGHGDVPMAVRAMRSGAVDFIEKPFNDQQLLDRVAECLSLDAEAERAQREHAAAAEALERLTARERQVVELVVEGRPSKVIAATLGISEKTVDVHRSNIMRKTHTRSAAELVRLWLRGSDT